MNINIILLEKIHNLGRLGDRVSVKPGYWRNYILPLGKGVLATPENIARVEAQRAELEKAMAEKLDAAKARASSLEGAAITLSAKAAEEGKLYGSLGTRDLVDAIAKATNVKVEKSEIHLPNGPIRLLGEHDIELQLHPDVTVSIKVDVVAEAE